MLNYSDSSGNVKIKVNEQKQRNFHGTTTVTINGGEGQPFNRADESNNKTLFLGDCEMPITKSVTLKSSGSDASACKIKVKNIKATQISMLQNEDRLAPTGQIIR